MAEKTAGGKHPCMRCKKNIGKTKCVQCQTCELWVHAECENIRPELFEILINPDTYGGVCWNCESCLSSTARLEKAIKIYESKVKEVEARQLRTDAEVEKLGRRMEDTEHQAKAAEEKRQREREEDRRGIYAEMREREARKLHLVIHRVGELTTERSTAEERKEWDMNSVSNIFKAMRLNFRSEEAVQFCRRVGEKGEEARPMIIGLGNFSYRQQILSRAPELRHTQYKEVGIVPDLTAEQRKEEAELRNEAESRNRDLSEEDKSKNLCWLVVGKRGMRRLIKGIMREAATDGQQGRSNYFTSQTTGYGRGGRIPTGRGGTMAESRGFNPERRSTLLDSRPRPQGGWIPATTEGEQRARSNSKRMRTESGSDISVPSNPVA